MALYVIVSNMNDSPFVTPPVSAAELHNSIVFSEHRLKRRVLRTGRSMAAPGRYRPQRATVQTRLRILEAATLLWASHGMNGIGVRSLARQIGVTETMINYVLGNRDELLAEILVAHLNGLRRRVRAAAATDEAAPPRLRLEALLAAYLEGAAAAPQAHFLLQHALGVMSPHGREMVRARYRALLELLGEPLMQLVPEAKGSGIAALVLAAVGSAGDALLWFEPAAEIEVPATARRLATMLLAGVGSEMGVGPRLGCGGPTEACARAWLEQGAGS